MSDKSPATRSERPVFWEAIRSALGLFSVWLFVGLALALPPLALASGFSAWERGKQPTTRRPGAVFAMVCLLGACALAVADAGATAVVQPGGSVRDAEVIAAADERGLAMVFTGRRHFRH